MLFAKWMNLILILGLINYSYEYNQRKEQSRRRARNNELRDATKDKVAIVLGDDDQLEREVRRQVDKNEKLMDDLTDTIKRDLSEMVDVAVEHVTSIQKWNSIQQKIHSGFTMVIDAYRTYIKLQRTTCDSLENFANDIISKYEHELNDINRLTPPTLSDGDIDIEDPRFRTFENQWANTLQYFNYQGATLRTALDCPNDLSRSLCDTRARIINPPPIVGAINVPIVRTITVQPQPIVQPNVVIQRAVNVAPLPPSVNVDPYNQNFYVPCDQPGYYNGYQQCMRCLPDISRRLFDQACHQCRKK